MKDLNIGFSDYLEFKDLSLWACFDSDKTCFINKLNMVLENSDKTKDEIEIKILEVDLKEITKKLEDLWAKRIFWWWIKDNRYDFDDYILRNKNIIFRTRETSSWDYLTIKKIIENSDITINREFEVKIEQLKKLKWEINKVWLKLLKEKKLVKYRISYELDLVIFDLDRYDDIPWLLEIEADSKEKLDEYITKLWLEKNHKVNYGYRWLKDLYNL